MGENIENYFEFALQLVKESGKIIKEAKGIRVNTKSYEADLVTQFDQEVENKLLQALKTRFPSHKFISEEDASANNQVLQLTDDPTWIIDPIDGTSNFIRGIPLTCISVGFTINKVETIGIIFNPFMDELFTAIKGKGAFFNGEPIHCSTTTDIKQSIYTCELSLAVLEKYRNSYLNRTKYLMENVQGFRSFGTAAVSLAYVACGKLECYHVEGLYPWDVAADAVIIREAGGYLCQANGAEYDILIPSILATCTRTLADQYTNIIQKADQDYLENQKKKQPS